MGGCVSSFIVDIITHSVELHTCLQGKDQLVVSVFDHVRVFEI